MEEFGFKRLTVGNWLEPDEVSTLFVHFSPDGVTTPITGDEWAKRILEPTLIDTAPLALRRLYTVAQGALLYGYFFYPLYTLAGEQLFRLAETAVNAKCQALGISINGKSFGNRVEKLIQQGVIPEQERELWHALWKVRNETSHPRDQMLVRLSSMIRDLWFLAETINSWFGR